MLVRFIDENNIRQLENVAYLKINGEEHLIVNPKNQPIEVLNENGVYEYIDEKPSYNPSTHYLEATYKLENNKVYSIYSIKELGEDG